MKQVAPAPPPCPSWTGFYVGGFGGYKFGNIDPNLQLGGFWDTIEVPEGIDLERLGSKDLDTSGFEAGGLIGYNYQWNKWVFGVEGAGGYLWLRNSSSDETVVRDVVDIHSSFQTHYLFTFGPRIGYSFCRWLPYITGGLAVGDLDYSQGMTAPGGQQGSTFVEEGNKTETNFGWMVGAGLEYAVTDHWRVRGQYQYIDLGNLQFDSVGTGFQSAPGYTGSHRVDLTEHNASFAIIYGF
jgi:outer membrane immunogenic protein